MSRAIQLTKIHALNWYGYRDSLPVKGNLVLAGVTGSGKSILMDLLMLVLVGPERAHHHFNRSATGSKSDRTIKGYCLLDTKREENGQPQYFHDKGVTTYIAAEFTWPDSDRVETWGLRFEFRSSGENDGSSTPFFYPGSLDKNDFLQEADDGKLRPSSIAPFKRMIESHGGRLFSSPREYLRDMANPSHLNFNKDVLQRLLPSAMSFTNLKSFDDFCRQFVLPAEAVPVEDVVSSFRDFQSYERELISLKEQLDRLTKIREIHTTHQTAACDLQVANFLAAEFAHLDAQKRANTTRDRLEILKEENRSDEERLEELGSLTSECRQRRESIQALQNESSEGRLYKKLTDDLVELDKEIETLRMKATRIDHQVQKRIDAAQSWVLDIKKAPLEKTVKTTEIDQAIKTLESCETQESATSLHLLASAADEIISSLNTSFEPEAIELRKLRGEKSELVTKINKLQDGISPTQQPLLNALQDQLPILSQHQPPRALREVCEVKDEKWRVAAEVVFREKFAVLVDPDHFEDARNILQRLPDKGVKKGSDTERSKAGDQLLIDLASLADQKPSVLKGALAETLETSDPDARRYIDFLFGDMIKVDTAEELSFHPSAVAMNGTHRRDGCYISPTPYDEQPFIGEKGLLRQLEIKRQRLSEIEASLRRLEPIEREVLRLIAARTQEIPQHHDILNDLVRVEDLPTKLAKYEQEMEKLDAIKNDEFEKLRFEAEDLLEEIETLTKEERSILKKGKISEINRTEKEYSQLQEVASRREDAFSETQLRIDIHKYQTRYSEWKQEAEEYTPALDVLAGEFKKSAAKAEMDAIEAIGDLKLAMADFKVAFAPKFDDLPDDGNEAAAYVTRLEQIENANIPEYEKKSITERKRWESLFRTQVLSRMQQALKNVESIIRLLNQQLRKPIGNDRYKIDKTQNPDFKIYRQLIDLNSLHHEDELFFSSMDEELKEALAEFLNTLVEKANSPEAARMLDYRQYFDYDLTVTDIRDKDGKSISVDKQSGKMSGGENQSPYFVAILASYLHAYNRHESRRKEPSLALVPIDEAFSKLSGERIQNCIEAMSELDLQGMFSMSSGNIPYAFSQCDELIVISRKEERRGERVGVRNVPVILYRDSEEGKKWMEEATES